MKDFCGNTKCRRCRQFKMCTMYRRCILCEDCIEELTNSSKSKHINSIREELNRQWELEKQREAEFKLKVQKGEIWFPPKIDIPN